MSKKVMNKRKNKCKFQVVTEDMPISLYYLPSSPASRAVLLTAKAINLNLNLIYMNSTGGETRKPEFLSINPQHCLPTLVDKGFVLWESRAICTYLASKYAKDDAIYPSDVQKRAEIDRLLHFDNGTLMSRFNDYVKPVLFGNATTLDSARLDDVIHSLQVLNQFLRGKDYITGNNITVADHSLISTVTSIQAAGVSLHEYRNIIPWMKRCESSMPGYHEAQKGLKLFKDMCKSKLPNIEND